MGHQAGQEEEQAGREEQQMGQEEPQQGAAGAAMPGSPPARPFQQHQQRQSPGSARKLSPAAKQPSLGQMLQRQAAAAGASGQANEEPAMAAAQGRRRLVEQWQGITLSQVVGGAGWS